MMSAGLVSVINEAPARARLSVFTAEKTCGIN